jgi:hypothetical protein
MLMYEYVQFGRVRPQVTTIKEAANRGGLCRVFLGKHPDDNRVFVADLPYVAVT